MALELFIFLTLVGVIAYWASEWNRNGFLWGLIAFVISPILAALFLLLSGRYSED